MDADTEAAGYGETVEAAQAHVETLRKRMAELWELVDELGNIADYKRIKSKALRAKLQEEVALVRRKIAAADQIERLEKIVKTRERIRFLRRVIRTREGRGMDASGPRRTLRNKLAKLHELESP